MEQYALAAVVPHVQLIINATPIGMSHTGTENHTPLPAHMISPKTLVYDMVYSPIETQLLVEAREAGAQVIGGLWMLVHQGAASFKLWTGKEAPIDVMFKAAQEALT